MCERSNSLGEEQEGPDTISISFGQPVLDQIRELIPALYDVDNEKEVLLKGLSLLIAARDRDGQLMLEYGDGSQQAFTHIWSKQS